MAFAIGGLVGLRSMVEVRLWSLKGLLDAPGGGGSDALVDRKRVLQVRGGWARAGVVQVAVAESFQGACFFQGRAEVACDGQRLGVALAGLAGVCSPGR